MHTIKIDMRRLTDWKTFHEVFGSALGFPTSYGHNMNAWVDCVTTLDNPAAGMTKIHVPKGSVLTLVLEHVEECERHHPELLKGLVDSMAFVNYRRIEMGQPAVLTLAYFKG